MFIKLFLKYFVAVEGNFQKKFLVNISKRGRGDRLHRTPLRAPMAYFSEEKSYGAAALYGKN